MTNTRSSLQTYSGWLTLILVVIGLSFIVLRATATSFRLPSAPQLAPSAEFRNPFTAAQLCPTCKWLKRQKFFEVLIG